MQQQNLELLNCKQLAEMLGVKVGTIYVWVCKKQLPQSIYRKLGRKPVFIKSAVEDWIFNGAEMIKSA